MEQRKIGILQGDDIQWLLDKLKMSELRTKVAVGDGRDDARFALRDFFETAFIVARILAQDLPEAPLGGERWTGPAVGRPSSMIKRELISSLRKVAKVVSGTMSKDLSVKIMAISKALTAGQDVGDFLREISDTELPQIGLELRKNR